MAPLKPIRVLDDDLAPGGFPRLQKRGPIEARGVRPKGAPRIWFPRLQKRGPIEANPDILVLTNGTLGFHAYKSVAPLKRLPLAKGCRRLPKVSTLTKAWPH